MTFSLTGVEIYKARHLALLQGLKLQMRGYPRRGRSFSQIIATEFGFINPKKEVYEMLDEYLDSIEYRINMRVWYETNHCQGTYQEQMNLPHSIREWVSRRCA